MVEQIVTAVVVGGRKPALRDRHSDARRNALSERTGSGFDARGPPVFRMTGTPAAGLAKIFQIIERHRQTIRLLVARALRFYAAEMKQAVEQHRGVADREHESIAVRPVG